MAQLQRAEEASVAVRSVPSLPIDLVRVFRRNCLPVAGVQKNKRCNVGVGQRFQGGAKLHGDGRRCG